MRDLASRVRAVLQADRERLQARREAPVEDERPQDAESRAWVSQEGSGCGTRASGDEAAALAGALGGEWTEAAGGSACLVLDRTWDPWRSHGRRRIGDCVVPPTAPIGVFDRRLAAVPAWASRPLFFDIETTGLSGGAGTLAFLAGCAWFGDEGLTIRQWLLVGPSGERALLEGLEGALGQASALVTFNGRTFDVPTMEMRWAFHRRPAPIGDLPHLDMLPVARRLWGFRPSRDQRELSTDQPGCSLAALERAVLGVHRAADVPGFEIPARYFHFLATGDPRLMEGVLEHNRHDLVSLAVLTAHALWLAEAGPDVCRDPAEQFGLGRCYERAGETDRACQAFTLAAAAGDRALRGHALAHLAEILRRTGREAEAVAAWQRLLQDAETGRSPSAVAAHERRAAEALAIYHEHQARDPITARRYAASLSNAVAGSSQRRRAEAAHRLERLDRKLSARGDTKGGPKAAPLLE